MCLNTCQSIVGSTQHGASEVGVQRLEREAFCHELERTAMADSIRGQVQYFIYSGYFNMLNGGGDEEKLSRVLKDWYSSPILLLHIGSGTFT